MSAGERCGFQLTNPVLEVGNGNMRLRGNVGWGEVWILTHEPGFEVEYIIPGGLTLVRLGR